MEEFLIMIVKAIVEDCEEKIKARLEELGDTNLFDLIKKYADSVALLEGFKFKEEITEEVKKEVFEELKKEASRRHR